MIFLPFPGQERTKPRVKAKNFVFNKSKQYGNAKTVEFCSHF